MIRNTNQEELENMKATGIVRRVDELGRLVIPKEIRRTMRLAEGTPLEIFTDREGQIILKKYSPMMELGSFAKQYAESVAQTMNQKVAVSDRDQIIAAAGGGMPTAKGRCAAVVPHTGLLWIQFSLRMPNSLRRMPHSAFGLRMTTTCISTPPFAHVYPIIASDGQKCSGKRFNLRWSPPPQARPAVC